MKIMLVDYDFECMEETKKAIQSIDKSKKKNKIKIDCYDDGEKAVEAFFKEDYDIILFELFLPIKDGFDILNTVNLITFKRKPILIGLTSAKNSFVTNRCIELGVDYLFFKPLNLQAIVSRVKFIINNFEEICNNELDSMALSQENFIRDRLSYFNFKSNNLGYKYLVEAILLCIENEELVDRVTKGLYVEIAKKYETCPANVERAIRHLLKSQFEKDMEPFLEIGFKENNPSNSEFISYMLYYIKQPMYM